MSAQTRDDTDGDGVPNAADGCPDQAGPRENGGCPPPDADGDGGNGSQDRDGDGVADFVDRCPDAAGTGFTEGCPVDQVQPTDSPPVAPATTLILPALPETGECLLATVSGQGINIRAETSTRSLIVGMLNPSLTYPILATRALTDGNWHRIAEGWVSAEFVRTGGSCDTLPFVEQPANPNGGPFPSRLSHPDDSGFVAGDGADLRAGVCTDRAGAINWLSGEAIQVNWSFGAETRQALQQATPQRCVKVDPNGHGFVVDWSQEPGAPESEIHWYAGFDGDEIVIIAVIPPPTPETARILLDWRIPFDPDTPPVIVSYFTGIDWPNSSVPTPGPPDPQDYGGILIQWFNSTVPEPGPPDSPILPEPGPPESPGILIQGINPAVPNPGPPDILWLPNGIGAGAPGIVITDAQAVARGAIHIGFSLPAVQ
ncbi:MAG: hypothetical protein IT319_18895 [Anaerolineae bacterium]|nr:hypothetical protein [Anaerolineae bacterium]